MADGQQGRYILPTLKGLEVVRVPTDETPRPIHLKLQAPNGSVIGYHELLEGGFERMAQKLRDIRELAAQNQPNVESFPYPKTFE